VQRLLAAGYTVRVIDNLTTGHRRNLSAVVSDVELVEGDVQSQERAAAAARGCELIFHHAALASVPRSVEDPVSSHAANVLGTLSMLLAARDAGSRRFVFASSSAVYGSSATLPKVETMAPAPISPYAVEKLAGDGYCRTFHEVHGLETLSLRYFNVFGPRQDPASQYAAVVPRSISALHAGRPPVVYGDGEQSRDFVHVDNVVDALMLALDADCADGRALNVASGERTTVNRLIEALGEIAGRQIEPERAPPRPGDVRHSAADITAARKLLGYEPRIGLLEGLRQTFEEAAAMPR
jgi:UDP-glucose 4-epimerase